MTSVLTRRLEAFRSFMAAGCLDDLLVQLCDEWVLDSSWLSLSADATYLLSPFDVHTGLDWLSLSADATYLLSPFDVHTGLDSVYHAFYVANPYFWNSFLKALDNRVSRVWNTGWWRTYRMEHT